MRSTQMFLGISLLGSLLLQNGFTIGATCAAQPSSWYIPDWMPTAKYNRPIQVLDTESALGRYARRPKTLRLEDLVLSHGHACDGLVIAFVQIRAVCERLFPGGVVDRTDLRVVSKNGPCWVDAVAIMTGARINFGTLRIDPAIGDGFIVQRISTGEAYQVQLKPGVFPKELATLERKIRGRRADGEPVAPADIDRVEQLANDLSRHLLKQPPTEILDVERLPDYQFEFQFERGERGDVINKNAPR